MICSLQLITTIFSLQAVQQPAHPEFTLELNKDLQSSDESGRLQFGECNATNPSLECVSNILPQLKSSPELIRSYVHSTSATAIQIKNSRSYPVYYFWVNTDTQLGQYNGNILPFGVTATLSYIGHTFYVVEGRDDSRDESLYEFTIDGSANSHLFIVPIDEENTNEQEREYYNKLLFEKEWSLQYELNTGYPYLSYYNSEIDGAYSGPRQAPILPFYSTDYIGQIHSINSTATYWHCQPDESWTEERAKKECQDDGYIELEIVVISTHPAIFSIIGTTSQTEQDYIIQHATPKLIRSRAGNRGGMVTNTRTSFNTWIRRDISPIIRTLYNRGADILGLKYEQMEQGRNSEQLQVLHYDIGQEYAPHHDFGSAGSDKQRVMTLLFYLNDKIKGGETFFPKAMGKGIKVHPGKGNSGLFYSILPDGNSDDLSLHWALPVEEGEKWACNFWIWDPYMRMRGN